MKLTNVAKCSAALLLAAGLLSACANTQFSQLGGSLLNSTGFMGGGDANALFTAGGKLVRASEGFSDEEEYYLGRAVTASLLSTHKTLKGPQLNAYVNKVGGIVAAVSDRPATFGGYHFGVLDTDEINAVSAPGGFIFITKGLLKTLPNEDSLAAVFAHEVAHVVKGHGRKAVSQSNVTQAITLIGQEAAASQGGFATQQLTSLFGDSVREVTDTLLVNGYSRSQEYDADLYAAELMARAGYDPNALTAMLKKLEEYEAQGTGWFATHPSSEDRVEELQDEFDFAAVKISPKGEQVRSARFKQNVGKLS